MSRIDELRAMRERIKSCAEQIDAEIAALERELVERNSDGHSIEDLRKLQDEGLWVVMAFSDGCWYERPAHICTLDLHVTRYRLAEIHHTTFIPGKMRFEQWCRAMIGKGLVLRNCADNEHLRGTEYYDHIAGDGYLDGCGKGVWYVSCASCTLVNTAWTAITREQYEAETKPQPPAVVPWTAGTFPKDRPVWVRQKSALDTRAAHIIAKYDCDGARPQSEQWRTWTTLWANYEQHDGEPCGTAP